MPVLKSGKEAWSQFHRNHKMSSIILLLACCSLVAFAEAIIGGEDVLEGELPYQIRITYINDEHLWCGGALVVYNDRQFILTSGICMWYLEFHRAQLIAGDLNWSDKSGREQVRRPNRAIFPDDFNYNLKFGNIAIVGYEPPFELNEHVQPIRLPEQGQNTTGDVLISGWGSLVRNDSSDHAEILQKLQLAVISDEECLQRYNGEWFQPPNTTICAEGRVAGNSHCYGDRGGPVVSVEGGYLAGIISYPESCAVYQKYTDVYTEVSHYVDWIKYWAGEL